MGRKVYASPFSVYTPFTPLQGGYTVRYLAKVLSADDNELNRFGKILATEGLTDEVLNRHPLLHARYKLYGAFFRTDGIGVEYASGQSTLLSKEYVHFAGSAVRRYQISNSLLPPNHQKLWATFAGAGQQLGRALENQGNAVSLRYLYKDVAKPYLPQGVSKIMGVSENVVIDNFLWRRFLP
ncbi:MAG: hypothetical protein M5U09_07190 [Gammaproteobacteria bacterium]|nr:hypothetical protein [Gammaproteobacteria bacterium]